MKVEACGVGSLRVSGSVPVEVGSRPSRGPGLPDTPHHHAQSLPAFPLLPTPPSSFPDDSPPPSTYCAHPASRIPRARFCAQSVTSTSSHPPQSPVNPMASLPIVWMVRPRPAEVGHSPQAPQVVSPTYAPGPRGFQASGFQSFKMDTDTPGKSKPNMAATRTSPSGQSLDPGGWMGRKGPLSLGLGWTQPLPGSSGEESRADQVQRARCRRVLLARDSVGEQAAPPVSAEVMESLDGCVRIDGVRWI